MALTHLKTSNLSKIMNVKWLSSVRMKYAHCWITSRCTSRKDMLKIVKVCLSTGARWNEAAQLRGSQLSKYKVTFTNTKNKKNRSVPISQALYDEIYKPTSGKLFEECYTPFSYILKNKIGAELPSGQVTHVLRHTFASRYSQLVNQPRWVLEGDHLAEHAGAWFDVEHQFWCQCFLFPTDDL